MGQQEKQHLFALVLHGLEQNWNPQGWQTELKAAERASTIIQMYAPLFPRLLSFIFFSSRHVVPVSAYSQVMVGASNFGELLGAAFVFLLNDFVPTPIMRLRMDAGVRGRYRRKLDIHVEDSYEFFSTRGTRLSSREKATPQFRVVFQAPVVAP